MDLLIFFINIPLCFAMVTMIVTDIPQNVSLCVGDCY